MIENMRGRSTETKYGRIPLWLYEAGVSLQAIATYGWLHGKYGHFDRVVPSYATLAKELKVSRGSVIAYVKELTGAGAVRIATSGAAGQTTNTYEIAFNEPFPVPNVQVSGGQNADQVVSGLYSGGQPADQGGQPVVQEEDVFKKTKKTSSSRLPRQRSTKQLPAVTPEEEDSSNSTNRARLLLSRLPAPWTLGPVDAERLAPQLAATADRLGWPIDDKLAAAICTNPGGITNPAEVLAKRRIPNLLPYATVHGARSTLPPVCRPCLDSNPHAARNARWRTRHGQPCPTCHPDALHAAA
ncbi:helix-turn-helix domain-containing protein [Kitasatospora sp. NBC_00240]|uniref:helix-turn-helix domain-containing protein n=1 Tax=Kitasatospora sp. NBC_00240 TaxID=2903567 RepID=UPI00225493C2|nr:helix-turn-helix domain-containing protein [Kitasatospora sp. NBC_00240]MCX5209776.1 helix-turn-helix domain-containing protein [Kitasatospora sp. NBC_00240]